MHFNNCAVSLFPHMIAIAVIYRRIFIKMQEQKPTWFSLYSEKQKFPLPCLLPKIFSLIIFYICLIFSSHIVSLQLLWTTRLGFFYLSKRMTANFASGDVELVQNFVSFVMQSGYVCGRTFFVFFKMLLNVFFTECVDQYACTSLTLDFLHYIYNSEKQIEFDFLHTIHMQTHNYWYVSLYIFLYCQFSS